VPGFEEVFKLLVLGVGIFGIPIGAYAAFAATRAIWVKPHAGDPGLGREVDVLKERVAELEAQQARMAELEERLDFAERLLVRQREDQRLPEGRP
jgi:hypothetical protein